MSQLRGWLKAAHAFPLSLVVMLTGLIALVSTDGEPQPTKLGLVLFAMLTSQLAIGWSNDYLDRETDAVLQPWKPLASGQIPERLVPPAVLAVLTTSFASGVLLGPMPLVLLIAGTACGLVYNFGVKDTRWSAVPFIVGLALLPPFVWSSLDVYRGGLLLLYAVGSPIALAVHIANGLPDLEADSRAGRKGLAVTLGPTRSRVVLGVCLLAPAAVVAASAPFVDYDAGALLATLLAYGALCAVAACFYLGAATRERYVWGFRLVALAGVMMATGWLAAV